MQLANDISEEYNVSSVTSKDNQRIDKRFIEKNEHLQPVFNSLLMLVTDKS
jgi:hypothetical protein